MIPSSTWTPLVLVVPISWTTFRQRSDLERIPTEEG
jgi:hypothetical protein